MTHRDGSEALQKAIYNALSGNLTDAGTAVPVTDHVTEGQAKPYVEVGEISTDDWGTSDTDGTEHVAEIHVYTGDRGRSYARSILRQVHDLLHHQALTVEGNQHVLTRFESSQTERDSDGLTYHGVSRFRVLLNYTG